MPSVGKRFIRGAVTVASVVSLGAGLIAGFAPQAGLASSHREAPLLAADPQADATDLYAYVAPDKKNSVTFVSSWIPFQVPAGGPNFYAWQQGTNYDIRIDNNGDAKADILYRVIFTNHYRNGDTFLYNTGQVTSLSDPDLNFYQTYQLWKITFDGTPKQLLASGTAVPSDVGDASMPNYPALSDSGVYGFNTSAGPGKVWVGQNDDPFFLDLRVFDLLYGGNFGEAGNDTLSGINDSSIVVQVPKRAVTEGEPSQTPVIGLWTTASRPSTRVQTTTGTESFSGPLVQVSRLGNPLVNEVVVPVAAKDLFNASFPRNDAQFLAKVNDPEVPHLINLIYGLPIPDSQPGTPGIQRDDLIAVFLTGIPGLNQPANVVPSEQLRLNVTIPPCTSKCSTLGVIGGDNAGYPNGRRLTDDVIDIDLQVLEGELLGNPNDLGDGVPANDVPFLSYFPYVAYPHSGSGT